MLQLIQDFTRFDHLPKDTRWQRRIRGELRFLQTMGPAYELLIQEALAVLQKGLDAEGVISNQTAEAAEQKILPAASEAKSYELLCTGHAHIDMNWMWGYDETINTVIDTFRTMLQLMEEYPDFKFSQSQASVYQILEEYDPDMLEQVKARVAEGRWEITASAWVETDKNMPSGESLSRHILYAKQYLSKMFDLDPDSLEVDFDPDTFGHNQNVPEISSNGGIKYYYHCRGRVEDDILNRWRSPSGAELIIYTEPSWYGSIIDETPAESAVKMAELTGSRTLLKVYGVGDHGGGPTRRDLDFMLEMNSWPVYPKFTFSTFREYFHTVEARRETLPIREGEINFLCDGCYTTQTRIKAGNRNSERGLQDAELFDAICVLKTDAKPHPEIFAEAWKKVLFNHFHDILPGSGVTETREYASAMYQEVAGAIGARRKNAMYRLADEMDTDSVLCGQDVAFSRGEGGGAGFGGLNGGCGHAAGKKRIFHLFNPSAWARQDLTEFVVWDYEGDAGRLAVRIPGGAFIPTQQLEKGGFWGHDFVRLLASVEVPAGGWTTVLVEEQPVQPVCQFLNDMRTQRAEEFVLENDQIRAVFDPATASLSSLYQKKTNRELLPEGGQAQFQLATEAVWKEVTGWNGGMSAWFNGRQKEVKALTNAEIRPLASSALRQRLEIKVPFGTASSLRAEVYLDQDSSMLCYKVSCDWREFGSDAAGIPCLQFTVPTVCAGKEFLYDVPFGFVRREGREMDLPANRFVLAEDAADALLLTAKTKYGYRTCNGRMAVTLIRGAYDPDPTPEIGHHEIEFAIGAAQAGLTNLEYAKMVQDYEHPIYALAGRSHGGSLPLTARTVELVGGNVALSSVKISEDCKAVIVKLYETENKTQSYALKCGFVPASVHLADQLERPVEGTVSQDGETVSGEIGASQIRILRLEF